MQRWLSVVVCLFALIPAKARAAPGAADLAIASETHEQ